MLRLSDGSDAMMTSTVRSSMLVGGLHAPGHTVCLQTRTCCCQGEGSRSGYESRELKRRKSVRGFLFDVICLLLSPSDFR
jgi:hypothetical protein